MVIFFDEEASQRLFKNSHISPWHIPAHSCSSEVCTDRLYGITMQEKGVSTLVSVSLIEAQMEREEEKAEL